MLCQVEQLKLNVSTTKLLVKNLTKDSLSEKKKSRLLRHENCENVESAAVGGRFRPTCWRLATNNETDLSVCHVRLVFIQKMKDQNLLLSVVSLMQRLRKETNFSCFLDSEQKVRERIFFFFNKQVQIQIQKWSHNGGNV